MISDIRVVVGLCILGSALCFALSAQWPELRRGLRRAQVWKQFGSDKLHTAVPSPLCERASLEYRVDRPTRSIP